MLGIYKQQLNKMAEYTSSKDIKWNELSRQFELYRNGGSMDEDEQSDLNKTKSSNLMTDSMKRREKLRAESIVAAAKAGKGYSQFETPNIPENFGVPLTDGFGYC